MEPGVCAAPDAALSPALPTADRSGATSWERRCGGGGGGGRSRGRPLRVCEGSYPIACRENLLARTLATPPNTTEKPCRETRKNLGIYRGFRLDTRRIIGRNVLSVQLHRALPIDDFHSLSLPRAEVKLSRVNQTQCFLRAARQHDRMAHNTPLEVDVCLRERRHILEFLWESSGHFKVSTPRKKG